MNQFLYEDHGFDDLTLNDQLAIERTSLANERTLLAYVRTMVGLIAVGGTLIKFFTEKYIIFTGWMLLAVGIIALVIGFMRYLKMYSFLQSAQGFDLKTSLKQDRLQYLFWLALRKLHLAPSNAN